MNVNVMRPQNGTALRGTVGGAAATPSSGCASSPATSARHHSVRELGVIAHLRSRRREDQLVADAEAAEGHEDGGKKRKDETASRQTPSRNFPLCLGGRRDVAPHPHRPKPSLLQKAAERGGREVRSVSLEVEVRRRSI